MRDHYLQLGFEQEITKFTGITPCERAEEMRDEIRARIRGRPG